MRLCEQWVLQSASLAYKRVGSKKPVERMDLRQRHKTTPIILSAIAFVPGELPAERREGICQSWVRSCL